MKLANGDRHLSIWNLKSEIQYEFAELSKINLNTGKPKTAQSRQQNNFI